ncbi:hypothetical protein [Peterkaempfera bronchialis]|uniref:hypothetical protein n=1 Tax=Peterkaempfera bronchialis TaxID=2126346 RepID=UPI0013B3F4B0|nr:hypothetical protein [Peterkaempfera bronchialis]
MTTKVLTIGAPVDDLHERRLKAVAAASARLGVLTGAPAPGTSTTAIELLRTLASAGRIAVSAEDDAAGPWTLSYVPSAAALAAVAGGSAPSWGARVDAKQQKALRRSRGAVIRLPFADPATGEASGDSLSTFTTDWSPFTAACAVVVHPDHVALAATEVRQRPYFSGRFVRHPLHGDLLPVWVADWAKPEFGTGAVIVNPAHSVADLEFARAIGLPIRFGLGEQEPGADPETWLTPPVIKTGVAVRAGRRHDGRPHEEAMQAYLEDLLASGYGEWAESVSLGRAPLAVLSADPAGEVRWAPALRARSLTEGVDGAAAVSVSIDPAPLLASAAEYTVGRATLVASSEAVTADLLWLRLLMLDIAVEHPPVAVVPVARVGSAQSVESQWLDGALLVAGRTDETVSVKAQLSEQIGRIAGDHAAAAAAAGEPEPAASKTAAKICEALSAADFPTAFGTATAVAKTVRRGGALGASERTAFLAALHVLFGLPLPEGFSAATLDGSFRK